MILKEREKTNPTLSPETGSLIGYIKHNMQLQFRAASVLAEVIDKLSTSNADELPDINTKVYWFKNLLFTLSQEEGNASHSIDIIFKQDPGCFRNEYIGFLDLLEDPKKQKLFDQIYKETERALLKKGP